MSAVSSTFGDDTATALKDAFVVIRTSDQNVAAGADQSAQRAAWKKITQSPDADMLVVLAQMKGAGPIAQNWLRAAADAIAQRHFEPGKSLPLDRLEKFVLKRDESPRARRVAFEWIDVVDETIRPRLLPKLLDDPSLELRYEAVAAEMARAEKLEGAEAVAAFKKAFIAARDLEQVKKCAEALKKLESPVNRAEHFGFVTDWHLIGLFDNKDRAGYAKEFPPEKQVDLSAKYQSLDKEVTWIEHHTDHQEGDVDLNKVYGEIKEVLAYAAGEVDSDSEREAQIRINCIAACKVWLNGELVIDHEVYHAGYKFDQYVANVRLNKGRNTILVKCCQNEQTQSWANVWKFALRVCDDLGGGIK
jgi:hypothetical protein